MSLDSISLSSQFDDILHAISGFLFRDRAAIVCSSAPANHLVTHIVSHPSQ